MMIAFSVLVGLIIEKAHANAFDVYCEKLHPDCTAGSAFAVTLAGRIGNFFAIVIAGAAVIAIVYGAIKLIASGGNDQGKEDAKKIIIAALVGLVLAIAAEAIITFIGAFVGGIG